MAKKVVEEQVNEQVVEEQVNEQVLPSVTIDKLINNEYNYDMIQTYNDNEEIRTIDNKIVTDTEELQYNDVDYYGRGFNSLEDAINYMNSDPFKNLGDADKNEFKKWLIKED